MRLLCVLALAAALGLAQSKPAGAGHWEGSIQNPQMDVGIKVDLAQNAKGEWIGDIDIEPQNAKDVPLSAIGVKENKVSFAIAGGPSFTAELAADGKSMKGEVAMGGQSTPFQLKWVSEPKVAVPEKNAAIGKEFEGTWDGAIETPDGNKLRLRVKLANGPDGATGTLNSLDQTNTDMPIHPIVQTGAKIKFELKLAGGSYEGEIDKEGANIKGTWSQGMFSAPVVLTKQK